MLVNIFKKPQLSNYYVSCTQLGNKKGAINKLISLKMRVVNNTM